MKSEKYHTILEAAIRVFAEHGYYQSTVAQIAREAGVADGTIYLYFKNKEDIILQFFSQKTRQVFEGFQDVLKSSGTAEEKLKRLVRKHLEEFQSDINMAVVFQAESRQIRQSETIRNNISEISRQYLEVIGSILEGGQQEGSIRKDLYMVLAKRFVLGAVEEVINTWVLSGGKYDLASMAEPLVELFINGIGNSNESGTP